MMIAHLRLVLLAFLHLLHPGTGTVGDELQVLDAVVHVVGEDPAPPVFGSREADGAAMLMYASRESGFQNAPPPVSWDARAQRSCGYWQLPCSTTGRADILTQARAWLSLLHLGARLCPESPAAPLSGGCEAAHGLAGRRMQRVAVLLDRVNQDVGAEVGVAEKQSK